MDTDTYIIDTDTDEILDFTEQPANYQVIIYGYDKEGQPTDYFKLVDTFDDPNAAVNCAAALDFNIFLTSDYPENIHSIELCVETAVKIEGYEELVGSIYKKSGKILKK